MNRDNNLDLQYQILLQKILNGNAKGDRTGTGTISIFGETIRHNMKEGFPLLTTKKMFFKGIVTELLWFLRGETNIRNLVLEGCHIWDGDAYKNYCKYTSANSSEWNEWMRDNGDGTISMYTAKEFAEKIRDDEKFAEKWGDLGPIYGKQWRSWKTYKHKINFEPYLPVNKDGKVECYVEYVDQIQNLIDTLKTNPDDRRMMVTAWNPSEIDQAVLPPCHYGFQVWTRNLSLLERWSYCKNEIDVDDPSLQEKLDDLKIPSRGISLLWNQRSVDTFLGLPFNIASYGLLLTIIAKIVNMIPEELIGNLGDTHLYVNHLEQAREQIERAPYELPSLQISDNALEFFKNESDLDTLVKSLHTSDFTLSNYVSHEKIKGELSN